MSLAALRNILGVFLLILSQVGLAQHASGLRKKEVALNHHSWTTLDSLSIYEPSLVIRNSKGQLVPDSLYLLHWQNARLYWKGDPDTCSLQYRVLPVRVNTEYVGLDTGQVMFSHRYTKNPFKQDVKLNTWSDGGLKKRGTISRGVMFGNSQDLSVNSNLNLQLGGKIARDIEIEAAITDDNIPLQPEGNTTHLREFDQVYIRLKKDPWRLTAGDFWLDYREGYFLRYRKKSQGLRFEWTEEGQDSLVRTTASASVGLSRGKFARKQILGQEGNQGPYVLTGAQNERFIIVLSGTERIYVDGVLLERGQNKDYTIDYNRAEISFMPRMLVTKDKRIVVEFQYSVQSYTRSLASAGVKHQQENWSLGVQVYSEQDNHRQPINGSYSQEQLVTLDQAGDRVDEVYFPLIDTVEFNENDVLYKVVDTLGYSGVYVHSINPDSARYRLVFTQVGTNKGNYIRSAFEVNGGVYKWVAPENGVPQGNYEPISKIITPRQKQMAVFNGEYRLNRRNAIQLEAAYSNFDINRLSRLDKENDKGTAYRLVWQRTPEPDQPDSLWNLNYKAEYRRVHRNFNEIERFRSAEFERDWNLLADQERVTEHLSALNVGLKKGNKQSYQLNSDGFYRGDKWGIKNGGNVNSTYWKGNRVVGNVNYLQGNLSQDQSQFLRYRYGIDQVVGKATLNFWEDTEINRRKDQELDTLLNTSYSYRHWGLKLSTPDTATHKASVQVDRRTDEGVRNDAFKRVATGDHLRANYEYKHRTFSLGGQMTYRLLMINDTTLTSETPENTLLGDLFYRLKLWKGAVTSNAYFKTGSGVELKRDFTFVEVNEGQGVYMWVDYDKDKKKDPNEFVVANFSDQAKYVRVNVPTNEYIKAFHKELTQSISIRPEIWWRDATGLKKWLRKFSSQSSIRYNARTGDGSERIAWNPYAIRIADEHLVGMQRNLRNTIYFQQSNPVFGMEYTVRESQDRQALSFGFQQRDYVVRNAIVRWTIDRTHHLRLDGKMDNKSLTSELFSESNYRLDGIHGNLSYHYQPGVNYRLGGKGVFAEKETDDGASRVEQREITVDGQWSKAGVGMVVGNMRYVQLQFKGEENSAVGFELLQGLRPGVNWVWDIQLQKSINKFLQLSIIYNGRKSPDNPAVHTGNVEIRALF